MTKETRYQIFKNEAEILLKKSPMNIRTIYIEIQKKYPTECNNREPCEHKGHFYQYGGWKHQVRDALQGLKKGEMVVYDSAKRMWVHK